MPSHHHRGTLACPGSADRAHQLLLPRKSPAKVLLLFGARRSRQAGKGSKQNLWGECTQGVLRSGRSLKGVATRSEGYLALRRARVSPSTTCSAQPRAQPRISESVARHRFAKCRSQSSGIHVRAVSQPASDQRGWVLMDGPWHHPPPHSAALTLPSRSEGSMTSARPHAAVPSQCDQLCGSGPQQAERGARVVPRSNDASESARRSVQRARPQRKVAGASSRLALPTISKANTSAPVMVVGLLQCVSLGNLALPIMVCCSQACVQVEKLFFLIRSMTQRAAVVGTATLSGSTTHKRSLPVADSATSMCCALVEATNPEPVAGAGDDTRT